MLRIPSPIWNRSKPFTEPGISQRMTGSCKPRKDKRENHFWLGPLQLIRLDIQSIISYQTSVQTPILLLNLNTLLLLRLILSTSGLQKEMKMMRNGLYQKLTPNSNFFNLMPKLAENHFLPGHQPLKREASRKTISSPILDHKMSKSEPPMETSILLKSN